MIRFMTGPADDLTPDFIYTQQYPTFLKALDRYLDILTDVIDGEDVLPGRFLRDSETGKAFRIIFRLDLEDVGEAGDTMECDGCGWTGPEADLAPVVFSPGGAMECPCCAQILVGEGEEG